MPREREITPNQLIEDLKASSATGLERGDLVIVKPTRGLPVQALVIGTVRNQTFDFRMIEVFFSGRVHRVDQVRVSRLRKTKG